MQKIILIRKLSNKEIRYSRLLKPFHEKDLVEVLETPEDILEFVMRVVRSRESYQMGFQHIIRESHENMTPSELYHFIYDKEKTQYPVLAVHFNEKTNEYTRVENVDWNGLYKFLKIAHDKGRVDGSMYFNDDNFE